MPSGSDGQHLVTTRSASSVRNVPGEGHEGAVVRNWGEVHFWGPTDWRILGALLDNKSRLLHQNDGLEATWM